MFYFVHYHYDGENPFIVEERGHRYINITIWYIVEYHNYHNDTDRLFDVIKGILDIIFVYFWGFFFLILNTTLWKMLESTLKRFLSSVLNNDLFV